MKLSIITVNLNNVKGLQQTIDSVLCQTWTDFEWLIIDGGSTDGSRELIDITASSCNKISFWCSEPDKGIYNAMNKGIVKAKGDYILFLNSGDILVDSDVFKEVKIHLNGDYDFIIGLIQGLDYHIKKQFVAMEHLYEGTLPHQASFISKKCFKKYGLYNETFKIVSDWEFFLKALLNGGSSIKFIDYTISSMQEGGISSNSPIQRQEREIVISQYYSKDARMILNYSQTFETVLTACWLTRKMYSILFYLAYFIKRIFIRNSKQKGFKS